MINRDFGYEGMEVTLMDGFCVLVEWCDSQSIDELNVEDNKHLTICGSLQEYKVVLSDIICEKNGFVTDVLITNRAEELIIAGINWITIQSRDETDFKRLVELGELAYGIFDCQTDYNVEFEELETATSCEMSFEVANLLRRVFESYVDEKEGQEKEDEE